MDVGSELMVRVPEIDGPPPPSVRMRDCLELARPDDRSDDFLAGYATAAEFAQALLDYWGVHWPLDSERP